MRRLAAFGLGALGVAAAGAVWIAAPRGPAPPGRFLDGKGSLARTAVLERTREADGTRTERVRLESTSGLVVNVLVRTPAFGTGPHPALCLLGGLRTGADAARHVPPGEDLVIASLDYQTQVPRKVGVLQALRLLPHWRRAVDASAASVFLVLDYLETRPDVEAARTLLAGGSFGVPFATIAGALDPRFEGVALLYGGGDLPAIARTNLRGHSPVARRALGWLVSPWLEPVDPVHFIDRIAPRPVLLVNGRRDQRIPEASARRLFEAAREPKRQVWLDTPHRIQGEPELTALVSGVVFSWMREQGWLPPAPG